MKKKTKLYLRLNLISLFFVIVSFISVTLAWFVYSGLSTVSTEVNVKAWYIELERDGKPQDNNITISLEDIYPGMETIEEEIKIKNLGDSDAQVSYSIVSARILGDDADNYVVYDTLSSQYVEDRIAHEYPFHINMDLSKKFILAGTDEAVFKVSISWPLDSGNDELDSTWGTKAYQFRLAEEKKNDADKSYEVRSAIRLDLKLTAEQYVASTTPSDSASAIGYDDKPKPSDIPYRLGNEILYDVKLNKKCTTESDTCIKTNVIDVNNTLSDTKVTLLPKVSKSYSTGAYADIKTLYSTETTGWNVETRLLNVSDILKVISKDIKNSVLVRPNVSDLVIGNLNYNDRFDKVIATAKSSQGYFKYLNKFSYFYSTDCYWLNNEYDDKNAFAVSPLDSESMRIYGELKTQSCKVIPVIIAEKTNLQIQN